ncbi:hypothetical protein ERICI_03944 [Paenibacillus larvae subsp. larvae]|nr:hypothetical protein ERICI_03944 [Paenibacillus larvae subsp. larvae]ETK29653.1 hypothetical protein ERIC1_1c32100 [Paenibacillus larvae subsp. larvae DSM 25719]
MKNIYVSLAGIFMIRRLVILMKIFYPVQLLRIFPRIGFVRSVVKTKANLHLLKVNSNEMLCSPKA